MDAVEIDNSSVSERNEAGNDGDAASDVTRAAAATTEDTRLVQWLPLSFNIPLVSTITNVCLARNAGYSTALKQLEALTQRTEKKDNFAKKFEKEIREEESRLLHLLDEEEKQRYVIRCLNVLGLKS